jgi:CDGSH-type Zn-finger protein
VATRKIVITASGPYIVYGGVPLRIETIGTDADGQSARWEPGRTIETEERYALCRCGSSATKPFCDGTHARVAFDAREVASRAPHAEQAERIDGPDLVLEDAKPLCAYARFCDRAGTIWALIGESGDPAKRAIVEQEARNCPSGRLVVREKATRRALEPTLAPELSLVEDPAKACSGPLFVKGGIPIESQDGTTYEVRNRVTLCRCGLSQNKPFCDGSHADLPFTDGLNAD